MPIDDTYSSRSQYGGANPFKIHVNIDILIFEGFIDVYTIDRWLNMLEEYFSIHGFSNMENIIFSLLKATCHLKD